MQHQITRMKIERLEGKMATWRVTIYFKVGLVTKVVTGDGATANTAIARAARAGELDELLATVQDA